MKRTAYPAHWTVRRARDAYLRENGFTLDAYDAKTTDVKIGPVKLRFPNTPRHRWALMRHDLHHAVTGYGTDFAGEWEVSAWELRLGTRSLGLYVTSIVALGALGGFLVFPRRTLRAWRAAASANHSLFVEGSDDADYEAMLDQTLGELRERLGVPAEGLAPTRELHAEAPRLDGHELASA